MIKNQQDKPKIIQVTNDDNITFNVVLSKNKENKNLVTFYDTR